MKRILSRALLALVTTLITGGLPSVLLAQDYWTGGAGVGNTNWSFAVNWSAGVPDTNSQVVFDDINSTTYASTQNAVNNAVDVGFTHYIRSLQYLATANNHFYGSLIPADTTLTLSGSTPEITLGAGYFANTSSSISDFFSLAGPGTLSVNNPSGTIDIHQIGGATLNLGNLTNFTATVSNVWVGVTANTNISLVRSPLGTLVLARTNYITTAAN